MPKPRYEVHSITGYSDTRARSTSWWVADTLDCYREQLLVTTGTRTNPAIKSYRPPGRTTSKRAIAETNCERLNAEDRADAA